LKKKQKQIEVSCANFTFVQHLNLTQLLQIVRRMCQ